MRTFIAELNDILMFYGSMNDGTDRHIPSYDAANCLMYLEFNSIWRRREESRRGG